MLALEGVSVTLGGRAVLRDLTLSVAPGEMLAILGPNGCGKSTALRVMAGLLRPDAGQARLGGQDLRDLSRGAIARQLGLLPQSGPLPPGLLVRDLVAMGRFAHQSFLSRQSREDEAAVTRALDSMEVADLALRRMGELSGGQVQRCRMAMLLAQETPVVLLDEPTTFLDLRHQYGILSRAKALAAEGRAVVAVLHDLTQASLYADRIALLHDGRVARIGPPAEVLTEGLIETVFGLSTKAVTSHGAVFHIPRTI